MNAIAKDQRGRFVAGNCGGPGRPPKSREIQFQEIFSRTIDDERFERIVVALANEAELGNIQAIKMILEYSLAKSQPFLVVEQESAIPEEAIEHTNLMLEAQTWVTKPMDTWPVRIKEYFGLSDTIGE